MSLDILNFEPIQRSSSRQRTLGPDIDFNVPAIEFIKNNLHFTPKEGRLMAYRPLGEFLFSFQIEILKSILDDEGSVKVDSAFFGFSRKTGKTWLTHVAITYLLVTRMGYKIINTSGTEKQAGLLFGLVKDQVTHSPVLSKMPWKIRRDFIENEKTGSVIERVASTTLGNLGLVGVSCVVFDELSAIRSRAVVETLLSGFFPAAGERALSIFISNPPPQKSHWSYEFVDSLRRKPNTAIFEWSLPRDKDPYNEKNWHEANPFIGEYLKDPEKNQQLKPLYENFKNSAEESKKCGGEMELEFFRYRLGRRVSQQIFDFVDVQDFQKCSEESFLEFLKEEKNLFHYIGIDLAHNYDFTAIVLLTYDANTGMIYLRPFLHLANLDKENPSRKMALQSRHDRGQISINYSSGQDWLSLQSIVKDFLLDNAIVVDDVFVDPNLYQEGLFEFAGKPVIKVVGLPKNFTKPIRKFQVLTKDKKITVVGPNEEFLEHFENACVSPKQDYCNIKQTDPAKKIDGSIATMNAMQGLIESEFLDQTFNDDDFLVI